MGIVTEKMSCIAHTIGSVVRHLCHDGTIGGGSGSWCRVERDNPWHLTEVSYQQQVILARMRIVNIAIFVRAWVITAIYQISVWVILIPCGIVRMIINVKIIKTATQIIHKLTWGVRVKWSPAGKIHIDAPSYQSKLLNKYGQVPRLFNTHIIPCRSRGCIQACHMCHSEEIGCRPRGS